MRARPTDKMSVLRVRELLKDCVIQANAAFEIFERKIFVWGVRAAIGQRESHQECFNAENFSELRDDRDTATFADERRIAVERFAQCALGCFPER